MHGQAYAKSAQQESHHAVLVLRFDVDLITPHLDYIYSWFVNYISLNNSYLHRFWMAMMIVHIGQNQPLHLHLHLQLFIDDDRTHSVPINYYVDLELPLQPVYSQTTSLSWVVCWRRPTLLGRGCGKYTGVTSMTHAAHFRTLSTSRPRPSRN